MNEDLINFAFKREIYSKSITLFDKFIDN